MTKNVSFWQKYWQSSLSEKSLGALYFMTIVPCFFFFLQGINARIGLSFLNPNIRIEVYILLVVLCLRKFFFKLKIWDYLFVLSVGVFCFFSPSIYPGTDAAVKMFGSYFVFSCLPFYLLGRVVNLDKDFDLMVHIGRIGVVINFLLFVLISSNVMTHLSGVEDENMYFAYAALPSVILVTCGELRKHNTTDLIYSFFGCLLLLSLGTRGPVLSYSLFIGGYLFIFKEVKSKILFRGVIVLALLVVWAFSDYIIQFLSVITSGIGGSSRVYEKMLSGGMTNTETRDWIYEAVFFELAKGSKIGYGIFYDRAILGMVQGAYCHNLFLELWLDFGYYIGSFLIILLACIILYTFLKSKNVQSRQLYLAFFCAMVVQLCFSSSYLESPNFWFFIGVSIAAIVNIKKEGRSHPYRLVAKNNHYTHILNKK